MFCILKKILHPISWEEKMCQLCYEKMDLHCNTMADIALVSYQQIQRSNAEQFKMIFYLCL